MAQILPIRFQEHFQVRLGSGAECQADTGRGKSVASPILSAALRPPPRATTGPQALPRALNPAEPLTDRGLDLLSQTSALGWTSPDPDRGGHTSGPAPGVVAEAGTPKGD